jgi:ferric-dicitrate binding protein FerR (iron transport regulator)
MRPADPAQTPADDGGPAAHPLDWLDRTGASGALLCELQRRRHRRVRRRLAVAGMSGMVALLWIASLLWQGTRYGTGARGMSASSTIVSMPERRILPDGSVVELNESAEIAVDYDKRRRSVALIRGQAYFQVARNDAIPFFVLVGGVEIRAVGTAFSVHAGPAGIEVLVTEGRVAVKGLAAHDPVTTGGDVESSESASNPPAMEVNAGNWLCLNLAQLPGALAIPEVLPLSPAEMHARLVWRVPRIEFSGTRLEEAIPMFNRYSFVPVILADPGLHGLQLSGILRADNVDALVRLLESNYGVTADRRGSEIVLRKGGPSSARHEPQVGR